MALSRFTTTLLNLFVPCKTIKMKLYIFGAIIVGLISAFVLDTIVLKQKLTKQNQVSQRGELCTPFNPRGTGLWGEYYSEENFKGKLLISRMDAGIDFDSTNKWPYKSVKWKGWLKPPMSGKYHFHLDTFGARITLSQKLLIDEIELSAGNYYPLTVEIPSLKSRSAIRLEWTTPYGVRYPIPKALLFPPSDSI